MDEARAAGITMAELGKTGGDTLVLDDKPGIAVATLRAAHENWFPTFMKAEL
jgi:phosphoribosylformylglycinamidine synthase